VRSSSAMLILLQYSSLTHHRNVSDINMPTKIIRNIGGNISGCERIIKYQFRKKLLCLNALNAGGTPIEYNGNTHQLARNDVMAVLGDARMEALLCRRWWASGVRSKGM
jgi:hypothetical protein